MYKESVPKGTKCHFDSVITDDISVTYVVTHCVSYYVWCMECMTCDIMRISL